jgi:putative flippase GtrA
MRFARFFRFVISGGLNTAVTYGIYLVLLQLMPYQFSYTIAYVSGIAIAYAFNRSFVFRSHQGFRSVLLFPLVYVAQYCLGILVVWLWIEKARMSPAVAPLLAAVIAVPFTYFLSRYAFLERSKIKSNDGLKT